MTRNNGFFNSKLEEFGEYTHTEMLRYIYVEYG